jgi:hypothetical protein
VRKHVKFYSCPSPPRRLALFFYAMKRNAENNLVRNEVPVSLIP